MESKYKERAKELLKESITDSNGDICRNYNESDLIIIMCQLAEEVELKTTEVCSDTEALDLLMSQIKTMYTKEQVEELLQKQRELCAKSVLPYDALTNKVREIDQIAERDILNAKLKID